MVDDVTPRTLEVASRTDRGVSARANALGLRSPLGGGDLLRRLNAVAPALWFSAAVPVAETFRVRLARRRVYRYFDPAPVGEVAPEACAVLVGTLDARSFGRGIPAAAPCRLPIESVTARAHPYGRLIEVCAPSFVWGMVRKIVGAIREVEAGRLSLAALARAARGTERRSLPLAEPEGLVLWEVEYDLPWTVRWSGPNRQQRSQAARLRTELRVRAAVLDALAEPDPAG